jgi:general secretion pathway protein N
MRLLRYAVAIIVLLLILGSVLLWTLPADVAYRHGARYLGPVALSGVRGTLWRGHADGVSVFGRDLGEIDWRMAKTAFLLGHATADVRIQGSDIDAAGTIERQAAGLITAHDVRFRFPAQLLAPMLDVPDIGLLGTVSGIVTEATLRGGLLVGATGNARWSDAGVTGQVDARFADIVGEFAAQPGGGIAGTAHDDGSGHLAVSATFHAVAGGFDAKATLRARNGDEQVQDTLRHVGEPQPDGSSVLRIRGRLLKLI